MYTTNRGVRIAADHLAWTFNGKADAAPFKNIVEVGLQTGPGSHRFLRICQITFADGYTLMVTNGNELAVPTETQRAAYRDFMLDLHDRLAAHAAVRERPQIEFKAGFTAKLHGRLTLRVALWTLIYVGAPLAAFLLTGDVMPFLLLLGALVVGTIFWRLTHANAPRTYDPTKLPKDLIG